MPDVSPAASPTALRPITCYRCGHAAPVSAKAMSVFCKKCQQRLVLEDLRITGSHPGRELATCGNVIIESTAKLQIQRVVGQNVLVRGRVVASIVARGVLEIARDGCVDGDVEAARVVIREGAMVRGRCKIVAPPVPEPPPQPKAPEPAAAVEAARVSAATDSTPASSLPPPPTVLTRPKLD